MAEPHVISAWRDKRSELADTVRDRNALGRQTLDAMRTTDSSGVLKLKMFHVAHS
jgi:hypothetical protein